MSNNSFIINVPVTYTKDGQEKTAYRRVGVGFVNIRNDGSGDQVLSLKLDFPVGATELVGFVPKPRDDEE